MSKKKTAPATDEMELVSFRLGKDLFKDLKVYAANETDESGKALSPSLAARRLMLDALKRHQQKKP